MSLTSEQRGQLRRDIERSEQMRADIREKLAEGQDIDLVAAWEDLEQLDMDIAKRIRMLRPEPV
jgi:hypothetical protein